MKRTIVILLALTTYPALSAQQIWFAPNKTDMLNSNIYNSKWSKTRDDISVFKFYYQIIRDTPLPILKNKFNYLRAHNIKVAIEWPSLTWVENGPGYKVEGFQEPLFSEKIIDKVKAAGGKIDYLALDEPIFYGHFKQGKNLPRMDIKSLVKMINESVKPVYTAFPELQVGDIEPINQIPSNVYKTVMPEFIKEYKKTTGHQLAFIHADIHWQGNWQPAVEYYDKLMKSNGGRFGVIFNAAQQSAPTYKWMMSARDNVRTYLSGNSPLPDDIVIQSWNRSPASQVGDNDPHSHSSLIQYFQTEKTLRR